MSRRVRQLDFSPHPLFTNRHVQTVLGIRWPQRPLPYAARQHHLVLDDGDRIVLHEDAPPDAADATPSVLLIHGLAGCHLSTYMCRMAEKLVARGYRVFRMDMRGCGAGEGLARWPTHCGCSSDVAAALHHIAELYCDSGTLAVGFSMGGTLTLNMLADAGEMRVGNLESSLVICPPIDLVLVERHFRTYFGRKYDKFFVKLLWAQILRRWEEFPETAPRHIPKRPVRLREIDELVIAPAGGYASADDYYQKTMPGPKLASIRQPVTIFFSQDDPVVPYEPLLRFPHSVDVETVVARHGGHLGFLGRPGVDPDFRWLDWRIIDWIEQQGLNRATARRESVDLSSPS